jgi:outer membrane protein assembly factor BamB
MAHRDATNTSAALGTTGPVRDVSAEWTYNVDGPVHSPVVSDGRVFVGSSDGVGSVVALDAASGEQLWRTPLDIGTQTAPAVVDDTVVVVTRDGRMYGLSVETGDTRWSYYELQVASDERIKYAPTVAGSTVYVVCPTDDISGAVHAVDSSDGSQQWVYRTDRWYPNGTPAVGEEMVYAGFDDRLVALETTTGTERWHYDTAGVVSTPTIYDGTVYAGANGNMYRFDSTTGELVWRNTQGFAVDSALATDDKRVYYLDSGQLVAIGHDGQRRWTQYLSDGFPASTPVVASDHLYVWLPTSNAVCAVTADDGGEVWSNSLGPENDGSGTSLSSTPAIVGTSLYVGSRGGTLRALSGAEPNSPETPSTGPGVESSANGGNGTALVQLSDQQTIPLVALSVLGVGYWLLMVYRRSNQQ